MTVVDPLYYDQTVGALRCDGLQVHHFTLLASRDTILRRLRQRGDSSNSWNARQLDRCLKSLSIAQLSYIYYSQFLRLLSLELEDQLARIRGCRDLDTEERLSV